ncbi:major facilitator superfamily domain-containing protein 4A-like [Neocloeon triangulifer]|uniref:major facilitator superfamily domain-containing protein 4A-like n=1 Tax=Neocloeon triangulifer TaxID=2078957 RepID=UPI00286F49EE|nr:major facilitator superfamily domain-containing protein 4A-like [Neocloeon triangulifer]
MDNPGFGETSFDANNYPQFQDAPPPQTYNYPQNANHPSEEKAVLDKELSAGQSRFRTLFEQHRHETVTYCFVFWSFGMCVALLGPTLMDLGCKTSNPDLFSTMSWAFFSQSLFTLLGSASGGMLAQRFGPHLMLLVSCVMLAVTLVVIAQCESLASLALVLGLMGFFMGTIDTVANLSMIKLYNKNVAPFLQALHFFYGLGAFLSPLISMPFLTTHGCSGKRIDHHSHHFYHHADMHASYLQEMTHNITSSISLTNNTIVEKTEQAVSEIQYAFWIMAVLQIPVIIMVGSLVWRERAAGIRPAEESFEFERTDVKKLNPFQTELQQQSDAYASPVQVTMITALTASLLFLYDGLQSSYGGYVYSYAVKSLSVPKAAYLNACFWGFFAFGRLVSIWLATRMVPLFMLLANIAGCLIAMISMVSAPHSQSMLYFGTSVFGLFLSSIYPTAISLAEFYIPLTSTITSILVVTAASGEMLMPVIVGHEFEMIGPASFLGTGLFVTVLSIFIFASIYITGTTIKRQSSSQGVFATLTSCITSQTGEVENEDSGLMRHHVKYYSRMQAENSPEYEYTHQQQPQEYSLQPQMPPTH